MKQAYRTKGHRFLELATWILWLIGLLIAIHGIRTLPDEIATHFALDGTPDGYGSPASLLILPVLMAFCLGLICIVANAVPPEYWNMPFSVTKGCERAVYGDMLTMVHAIGAEIAGFTVYSQIKSYQQSGTGILTAVGILFAALAVTIVLQCRRASRHNKG